MMKAFSDVMCTHWAAEAFAWTQVEKRAAAPLDRMVERRDRSEFHYCFSDPEFRACFAPIFGKDFQ